jgi:hypothetical protein
MTLDSPQRVGMKRKEYEWNMVVMSWVQKNKRRVKVQNMMLMNDVNEHGSHEFECKKARERLRWKLWCSWMMSM